MSRTGRLLVALIGAYRVGVSPARLPSCRYEPTCSGYAVAAITGHGAARGLALTTWRVLRCAPWGRGGYDPVPATFAGSDLASPILGNTPRHRQEISVVP